MKKSIYYISIALMCAGSLMPSDAQELSTKQERLLKATALNRLDEYRAYHSMGDEEIYYNFLDLFANDSCKVYNDQLGLGGKDLQKHIMKFSCRRTVFLPNGREMNSVR